MITWIILPLSPVGLSTTLMEAPSSYMPGTTVLWRNGIEIANGDVDGYTEVPPKRILLDEPLRDGEVVQLGFRPA